MRPSCTCLVHLLLWLSLKPFSLNVSHVIFLYSSLINCFFTHYRLGLILTRRVLLSKLDHMLFFAALGFNSWQAHAWLQISWWPSSVSWFPSTWVSTCYRYCNYNSRPIFFVQLTEGSDSDESPLIIKHLYSTVDEKLTSKSKNINTIYPRHLNSLQHVFVARAIWVVDVFQWECACMFKHVQTDGVKNISSSHWRILSNKCSSLYLYCLFHVSGSADRTVKFFDLETFELIGSAGPEVSSPFLVHLWTKIIFAVRSWSSLGPASELALTINNIVSNLTFSKSTTLSWQS